MLTVPVARIATRPRFAPHVHVVTKISKSRTKSRGALASPPPPVENEEDLTMSITDYMMEGTDMAFEPIYRVILHFNNWSDNNLTARLVKQAVPPVTYTHALRSAENAAAFGSAIVTTVAKDDAELYELRLNRLGLKASIEVA